MTTHLDGVDERELIRRALAGDDDAFAALGGAPPHKILKKNKSNLGQPHNPFCYGRFADAHWACQEADLCSGYASSCAAP